jgi:hypothetical protein
VLVSITWLVRIGVQSASTSSAARREDSWQRAVAERAQKEGKRFEVDVAYYGWPVVLGTGMFVGGVAGSVPLGWAILGLALAIFSGVYLVARVKYGSGKMTDLTQVMSDILRWRRHRSHRGMGADQERRRLPHE